MRPNINPADRIATIVRTRSPADFIKAFQTA
jgi:hypothetical protein